jgi:UDP-N-acetyl-D-mannosaminouronate:lipid I N-acetyl-D-mannosaminouronosyltransferase
MEKTFLGRVQTFSPESREELIDFAFDQKKILVAVNAEKIINADGELLQIINQHIGYPDGIGAVWALKKKGYKNAAKIPGCELWLDIIHQSVSSKTFYLIGGTQEVIDQTIEKLNTRFPAISILGYRNGYVQSPEEVAELKENLLRLKPDVVFVAMGTPKQEKLMQELHAIHPAVYQGLGGSFDVFTDKVQRAPKWWVDHNLEWAYRLVKQPRRIRRQLQLIPFFVRLKFNKL